VTSRVPPVRPVVRTGQTGAPLRKRLWIGDKELILIQNSSILGRMEDNPIYLIILDPSKRER
jgi:hypothetical protein